MSTFFILTKASWRIFAIKGGMSIFHILRVFSMGHDFFSKLDSTLPVFHEQNLRCLSLVFAELRICCSWDNNLSHVCPFIFRSDAGIMLIFHLQSRIWEFHFPFTCNRYGKCFGISVTHLTSILEIHGSSPGVSNNICLHFYFLTFHCTISFEY